MIDRIFILTACRPTEQTTYQYLPAALKARVTFVVQAWERDQYHYDADYLVLPDTPEFHHTDPYCIGRTRHYVYHAGHALKYCVFDDDLRFLRRNAKYYGNPSNMEKSKRLATDEDILELFATFDKWLDEPDVAVCGVGQVAAPPSGKRDQYNRTVNGAYWLNGPTFQDVLPQIDPTIVRTGSDDYFILSLLTNGYRTRVMDEFVFDNASVQRKLVSAIWDKQTPADTLADHQKMETLFPGIYTVLYDEHGNRVSGGYRNHGKRRIAWSKAYRPRTQTLV